MMSVISGNGIMEIHSEYASMRIIKNEVLHVKHDLNNH